MNIIGTCLDCAPAAGSVAVTVAIGVAGLVLSLLGEVRTPSAAVVKS